jgi:hypothetical protein
VKTWIHISLVVSTVLVGCAADPGARRLTEPPRAVERVDKVTLLSLQTAISLDHNPGPDGVRVQAHLFRTDRPEPVLVNGKLQFLLYENRVTPGELHAATPHLVWTFSGAKLERHRTRTLVGWGYAAELRWGTRRPNSKTISLAVRYIPERGTAVYSSPVVISMR